MIKDKLTALAIKHAKPGKHFDGGGLYLQVKDNGARYWRQKYRFGGKEHVLAFGTFPDVSLSEARERRDDARKLLRDGKNPATERKAIKASHRQAQDAGFAVVADAWLVFKSKGWKSETLRKAKYVINAYLIPSLKSHSIAALTTKQAMDVLLSIAENAPTLASKAQQYLGGIVKYAIHQGLREEGHILSLRGTLPSYDKGHMPAIDDPKEVPALLNSIDAYPSVITRSALKIANLTIRRPGEVAAARWAHIDLDKAEWTIPGEFMKMKKPHTVPLSTQAVAVLRVVEPYSIGQEFVFPALARQKSPHLSRDAMSKALREIGYQGKHVTHGFRGMFRTMAREQLGIDVDVLEAQLAHAKKGETQDAYDHAVFIEKRRRVMQAWADYLDNLRAGGKIIPIKRKMG